MNDDRDEVDESKSSFEACERFESESGAMHEELVSCVCFDSFEYKSRPDLFSTSVLLVSHESSVRSGSESMNSFRLSLKLVSHITLGFKRE